MKHFWLTTKIDRMTLTLAIPEEGARWDNREGWSQKLEDLMIRRNDNGLHFPALAVASYISIIFFPISVQIRYAATFSNSHTGITNSASLATGSRSILLRHGKSGASRKKQNININTDFNTEIRKLVAWRWFRYHFFTCGKIPICSSRLNSITEYSTESPVSDGTNVKALLHGSGDRSVNQATVDAPKKAQSASADQDSSGLEDVDSADIPVNSFKDSPVHLQSAGSISPPIAKKTRDAVNGNADQISPSEEPVAAQLNCEEEVVMNSAHRTCGLSFNSELNSCRDLIIFSYHASIPLVFRKSWSSEYSIWQVFPLLLAEDEQLTKMDIHQKSAHRDDDHDSECDAKEITEPPPEEVIEKPEGAPEETWLNFVKYVLARVWSSSASLDLHTHGWRDWREYLYEVSRKTTYNDHC